RSSDLFIDRDIRQSVQRRGIVYFINRDRERTANLLLRRSLVGDRYGNLSRTPLVGRWREGNGSFTSGTVVNGWIGYQRCVVRGGGHDHALSVFFRPRRNAREVHRLKTVAFIDGEVRYCGQRGRVIDGIDRNIEGPADLLRRCPLVGDRHGHLRRAPSVRHGRERNRSLGTGGVIDRGIGYQGRVVRRGCDDHTLTALSRTWRDAGKVHRLRLGILIDGKVSDGI